MSSSRLCSGSVHCLDCDADIPLSFHLYVGGYNGMSGEKTIVGLGTAIPKRWADKLPTFTHPFRVWRKTEHSPILLEEELTKVFDRAGYPPWDVMPDVLRIFRGRRSLERDDDQAGELEHAADAAATAAADLEDTPC